MDRAFDTRLPSGCPSLARVNPQRRCTRRIILQKARHQSLPAHAGVTSDCWCGRGFRVSFIPLSGCFSPFPHGTGSLSVAKGSSPWRVVPPASHKLARGSWYSGSQPGASHVGLPDSHRLWCGVPTASPGLICRCVGPTTPVHANVHWFGLDPVRSPLLRVSRLILPRRATEMFQFTHCPPSLPMCSAGGLQTSLWRGCPIRILRAQRLYAAPPERFAGLRVLLRPFAPRHPPRPLCSLFSVP